MRRNAAQVHMAPGTDEGGIVEEGMVARRQRSSEIELGETTQRFHIAWWVVAAAGDVPGNCRMA